MAFTLALYQQYSISVNMAEGSAYVPLSLRTREYLRLTSRRLLASAVIIPETEEEPNSPNPSAKRRLSSVSLSPSKRSRVSADQDEAAINTQTSIIPGFGGARARQASKDVDERKRGKRLFGALLGTLANNSSSTIQRRRVDIEKKQKEKLKLQAEEDDQQKKSRLDNLMQARRQEQKKYDRQSV